jgi:hypothetical protein
LPNRLGLAAMFLLVTAAAGCTTQAPLATAPSPPASRHAGATAGTSATASASASPAGPAIFPGPDGTEARWVVRENERPGTTAWKIHGRAGGISGFAGQVYADAGQQVTLYVSTAAPWFRAQAFRMGWYQGRGARLAWTSPPVTAKNQSACPVRRGVNMVACDNWTPSLTFRVTPAFVPGDYLIKLTAPGNRQSYVPLTIWDPASTATYVIKNDVFTWQAWNFYGGYDYYQGLGSCPPGVYPICSRARVVSYDRPYAAEQGSPGLPGAVPGTSAEPHAPHAPYAPRPRHPAVPEQHRNVTSLLPWAPQCDIAVPQAGGRAHHGHHRHHRPRTPVLTPPEPYHVASMSSPESRTGGRRGYWDGCGSWDPE